jgi:hypothetical protein
VRRPRFILPDDKDDKDDKDISSQRDSRRVTPRATRISSMTQEISFFTKSVDECVDFILFNFFR